MKSAILFPSAILLMLTLTGAGAAQAPQSLQARKVEQPVSARALPLAEAHAPAKTVRHKKSNARRTPLSRIALVNSAATLGPDNSAFVKAMQVVPYEDGTIYQLYAAPERITDIILQPGEALGSVASGDTSRWIIGDTSSGAGDERRVHVLVKPSAAGLATNLLITTDRRSYHISLKSSAKISISSLSWIYPKDALIALTSDQASRASISGTGLGIELDRLNFNYAISGDKPRWRPVRTFDDGRKTFIEFPPDIGTDEAPPLFLINGKEAQLVNYRMQGRFYIVDRLFDTAELRLGTDQAIRVGIRRLGRRTHLSKSQVNM